MDKKAMMESMAQEAREKALFTGTWLFAEKGKVVSQGALGFQDPEDKVPMGVECVFDLASVSKNFTAAAVLILQRRGLLGLDDDVRTFFPEIPYEGVRVWNLLNHTGGLPDYMAWVNEYAQRENTIPDNSVIVRFLAECGKPARFAPGEKHEYSNTGYCLLAEIVTKVSGIPFEDFLRKEIFEPAGMATAHVRHRRKDTAPVPGLAHAMVLENDRFVTPETSQRSRYVVTLDGNSGDGNVYASVLDLFAWDQALRTGKVLTPEEQELMYTPGKLNDGKIVGEEGVYGYGFGWYVVEPEGLGKVVSHSGGWPGVDTWYGRYLDADMVLVLLSCRDGLDARVQDTFYHNMSAIARGKEAEIQPLEGIEDIMMKDPDKSGWAAFCGKYEPDPDDESIDEVFLRDGDLWAWIVTDMGTRYALKLYPLGENTFSFREDDTEVTFGENCFTVDDETFRKISQ